jgi:glutamyl/glutaminyl-tRNA synthetase
LKKLLLEDKAYICFADEDYLTKIKEIQKDLKIKIGYYSHWAKWRYV